MSGAPGKKRRQEGNGEEKFSRRPNYRGIVCVGVLVERSGAEKMGWKGGCCCWGVRSGGDLLCLLTLWLGFLLPACRTRMYTNHWAVRISGGLQEANRIASKYGYINIGQVTLRRQATRSRPPSPGSGRAGGHATRLGGTVAGGGGRPLHSTARRVASSRKGH